MPMRVAPDAIIGPLCVVERGASVGTGSWLKSRVTLCEDCAIGERCIVHPGAVIGADRLALPQEQGPVDQDRATGAGARWQRCGNRRQYLH